MSSDLGGKKPRAVERLDLAAEVGIRRTGARAYRTRVFDASAGGCKIEFVERPGTGERIWIKFDGLEALGGTVRWVREHAAGVQFERPLHEAVFQRLVEASRKTP